MTVPFAYACAFLYFLIFGGMTGISLAVVSLDVHWHDTYYVVAHFHFVMVGTVLMAFMAALHYWFPKMFGRRYNESAGYMALTFLFIGFNGTFMPQFMLGNMGMPRRYFQYEEVFRNLNVFSSAGAALLGVGFGIVALYLAIALLKGEPAGDSPWHSRGYEWRTASPPEPHNFHGPVVLVDEPHNYYQEEPHPRRRAVSHG
jgi:cytochrome c oxidase subunit 1